MSKLILELYCTYTEIILHLCCRCLVPTSYLVAACLMKITRIKPAFFTYNEVFVSTNRYISMTLLAPWMKLVVVIIFV